MREERRRALIESVASYFVIAALRLEIQYCSLAEGGGGGCAWQPLLVSSDTQVRTRNWKIVAKSQRRRVFSTRFSSECPQGNCINWMLAALYFHQIFHNNYTALYIGRNECCLFSQLR